MVSIRFIDLNIVEEYRNRTRGGNARKFEKSRIRNLSEKGDWVVAWLG